MDCISLRCIFVQKKQFKTLKVMTKKEMLHEMFLNTEYEKNIERMAKKPKKYIWNGW